MPLRLPDHAALDAMLDEAVPVPLWLDTGDRPAALPALRGDLSTDLLVVGGGFTGLWTALRAVEREPGRRVVLLEADRIAEHATGRNGGFCEASLTHGEPNGVARWPAEYSGLHALGLANLADIVATVARYGIDCGLEENSMLTVATRPHEVAELAPESADRLDAAAVRALVDSPTYLAGIETAGECVLVDPARLAWGLAAAAQAAGVQVLEGTPARSLRRRGDRVHVSTPDGQVVARHVVLATNAFRPLLNRLRWHTVPVYDYVLATEPLTAAQLASVRWEGRQGIADAGNEFHYYRLTPDNRILWGGYEAVYHYGRRIDPSLDQRRSTHRLLAEQFYETFPQLSDVRFSHRWGGVIDTSTRFCAFFGTAAGGRVTYALGFTGLGVGASRFAADTMLDLLDGEKTERTALAMVRRRALPFPPEPIASVGIQLTRWSMARADRTGRRNAWLHLLDRLGLGFDS